MYCHEWDDDEVKETPTLHWPGSTLPTAAHQEPTKEKREEEHRAAPEDQCGDAGAPFLPTLTNPVQYGPLQHTQAATEGARDHQAFNMFSPYEDQQFTVDLDFVEELLASMNVKRPADDNPTYYKKMPHKRAAIDPNQPSHYAPPRRTAPETPHPQAMETEPPITDTANRRMPRQRIPINISHDNGAGPSSAARPRPPPGDTATTPAGIRPITATSPVTTAKGSGAAAAQIADQKGKDIADSLCKKLSLDGIDGSAMPTQGCSHLCSWTFGWRSAFGPARKKHGPRYSGATEPVQLGQPSQTRHLQPGATAAATATTARQNNVQRGCCAANRKVHWRPSCTLMVQVYWTRCHCPD